MMLTRVGLQKTTLLDFPGQVAATVFTPGCNLRCPYCHNPLLLHPPYPEDLISLDELDRFLAKRAKVLGGVCISGGEPLLHENLDELLGIIHRHGLKVKLDTNGTFPERLARAQVEYIAMDLKTVPEKYEILLGAVSSGQISTAAKIRSSIKYLQSATIPYEIRTTVVPGIIGAAELREILPLLQGAERYVLTPFRQAETLDPAYATLHAPGDDELNTLCELATQAGVACEVRT